MKTIFALLIAISFVGGDEELLREVKAEPKVRDAVITSAGVLYAGVLDDGTKRDGYAAYLCEIVKDHRTSTVKRVKVVKFNSHKDPKRDNAYGILLGECWCGR